MSFLKRLLQRGVPVSAAELQSPADAVQSAQQAENERPKLPTLQQVLAASESPEMPEASVSNAS
jgi:hypothetical protein